MAAAGSASSLGNESCFRMLIEKNADGILVVRPSGVICFLNPAAELLLERRADEVIGSPFGMPVVPGEATEIDILRPQDQSRIAEMRVVELEWEGERAYLASLRDITERKRTEEALRFLDEASALLARSLDYTQTLTCVARLIVSYLADWCLIDLLEGRSMIHRVAAAHTDTPRHDRAQELLGHYALDTQAGRGLAHVLQTGRPAVFEDLAESPLGTHAFSAEQADLLSHLGCTSAMIVPLLSRGRTLGAITFVAGRSRRRYGPADLALAGSLAARCALAVDNAQLYAQEQQARQSAERAADRLGRLKVVTEALLEALTLEQVADVVVSQGMAALGASSSCVVLRGEEDQLEVLRSVGYGPGQPCAGPRFAMTEAVPVADGVRGGEPVWLESREVCVARYPRLQSADRQGPAAWAAFPLLVEGRVIGGLELGFPETRRLTEDDRAFMLALARECALALERARLYQAEQRARARSEQMQQRLRLLAEAGEVLTATLDADVTLRNMVQLVVPALADGCLALLIEESGRVCQAITAHVHPEQKDRLAELLRYPPFDPEHPGSALARALRSGKAELITDVQASWLDLHDSPPELHEFLREMDLRALMSIPLGGRRRTLGSIVLVTVGSSARVYTGDDLALAEEVAHRTALAVDNACLYREVQEAARRKDEFLAMLAHELRNPLAPIANGLHVLTLTCPQEAGTARALEIMERQVRHMVRLIDDLLDVSRITRGKIHLRKEVIELAPVVAGAVEATRGAIELARHKLHVSLPPEPICLEADATRLQQMLANLLHNAAKYTDAGGTIWLTAQRDDGDVVLRVRDTGVGISPEMLPRIFDLFIQADRSLDRSQGGLGIGLTVVRSLVEMHGGSIEAHSDGLGKGSEFVIRLPALPPSAVPRPQEPSVREPASTDGRPLRVLVVEDNPDGAESLAVLLRLWGHEVRIAHDGHSALAVAKSYRPDAVLLDIGLPGMDGYEVSERLRDQAEGRTPSLVALTGYGRAEDRRRSRAAGISHHLVKPVDALALKEILANMARTIDAT